jgi:hypothetical protein
MDGRETAAPPALNAAAGTAATPPAERMVFPPAANAAGLRAKIEAATRIARTFMIHLRTALLLSNRQKMTALGASPVMASAKPADYYRNMMTRP